MVSNLTMSVVINTYNRASHLKKTLQSLMFQRYEAFEVIVVNGPSVDDTEQVVADFPFVKLRSCPKANLSMSRNIGIAAAAGDVVCFLDDDAIAEPYWLARIAQAYTDEISGIGGYLLDNTGVLYQCRAVSCDFLGRPYHYEHLSLERLEALPEEGKYPSPTGANCTFRREALLEIGGFDETYHYYLDETDVCLRLHEAGRQIVFVKGAEVHHKYAGSHLRTNTRVPISLFQSAKSKAYFAFRHGLKRYSEKQVWQHINAYQNSLRKDNANLLAAGFITQAKCQLLNEEVERGLDTGREYAASRGPLLLSASDEDATGPGFTPAQLLRPAGERLRIAFICRKYPPYKEAGISLWTKALAEGMAQQGHETHIVSQSPDIYRVDFENRVWVHRLDIAGARPGPLVNKTFDAVPGDQKHFSHCALEEIKLLHYRRGLDLVSSPIWDVEGAAFVDWRRTEPNAPHCVVSLHTTASIARHYKRHWREDHAFAAGTVKPIVQAEYEALKQADALMANSNAIVERINSEIARDKPADLASIDVSKIGVVPHGILGLATEQDLSDPNGADIVQQKMREGLKWIVFPGRLEVRKGADQLLAIIPALLEKYDNVGVAFAGDDEVDEGGGSLKQQFLMQHGSSAWLDRVVFMGHQSRSAYVHAICSADLIVCSSRFESFGLVYLEAMSAGKACVVANAGAAPEIFDDGRTGVFVQPEDNQDLMEKIEHLLTNEELRAKIGAAANAAFNNHFTIKHMADEAIRFYFHVLEGKRAG